MSELLQLVIFVQGWGPSWEGIMRFFSFLGTEEFFLLVLPLIYWSVDFALGLRVGVILLTSGALNTLFKMLFHAPRPYWVSEQVVPLSAETSFGIPSGHAQISVGVWGMIAAGLRRTWSTVLAVLLIFFIGLSRLYLGVHFPQDVLVGWIIGGLLLWGFLRLEEPFLRRFRRLSFGWQLASVWLFSLALIFCGIALRAWNTTELPSEWIRLATHGGLEVPEPWNIGAIVSPAAALFGMVAGALWLTSLGGFTPAGKWWQHLLRYGLGLLGVLILWMGLGAIFPRGETWLALSLRYVRYALIGFWIGGLAPYIFHGWLSPRHRLAS